MIDIKIFTEGAQGAGKGRAGGVIRSENWEHHKNSTHTKIKFYIIFIIIIFSTIDIKILQMGGQGGQPGAGFIFFAHYYIISSM